MLDGLFSDRAIRVIGFAIEEADSLNHVYLGTEHILLGVTRETDGLASLALRELGVSTDEIRSLVLRLLNPQKDARTTKIKWTPRARKVIEYAIAEASPHNRPVGTESILLGLLRENDGVAATVLQEFEVTLDKVRGFVETMQLET